LPKIAVESEANQGIKRYGFSYTCDFQKIGEIGNWKFLEKFNITRRLQQWRSHETFGRSHYFDFKRGTVFCLVHRLSKHKTTRYARSLEMGMATFAPLAMLPLATPMSSRPHHGTY